MYYFNFLVIILAGISGLYLGIFSFGEYTNITRTADKVSISQIIKMAARFGVSSSLVFFAIMLFGGVLEKDYIWNFQNIAGTLFISSILGVVVIIGATYQIYTTALFRDG
jgi:hypothetical protein